VAEDPRPQPPLQATDDPRPAAGVGVADQHDDAGVVGQELAQERGEVGEGGIVGERRGRQRQEQRAAAELVEVELLLVERLDA